MKKTIRTTLLQYSGIAVMLALWVAVLANLAVFKRLFGHSSMTIAMLLLIVFVLGLAAISIWGVHASHHDEFTRDC